MDGSADAITAMFRIDGKFYTPDGLHLPFVLADLPRPDIPTKTKNHGFLINSSQIPDGLLTGNHTLRLCVAATPGPGVRARLLFDTPHAHAYAPIQVHALELPQSVALCRLLDGAARCPNRR